MTASRCGLRAVSFLVLTCVTIPSTLGQPVPWHHPDGRTHWYEVVAVPGGITWIDANAQARATGGHLATITSAAESAFVFTLVDDPAFWNALPSGAAGGPWLGGIESPGSPAPGGAWKWNSGEPFGFSGWAAGQPDDMPVGADRIHFQAPTGFRAPTWGDQPKAGTNLLGFVIEWGWAPDQTVGLFQRTSASFDGYTLFGALRAPSPIGASTTDPVVLLDPQGRVANTWPSAYRVGFEPYLLDNGDVMRMVSSGTPGWAGGVGGRVERVSWDGNLVWEYTYDTQGFISHHDIAVLPNGNVLMIAWEKKTAAEAIAAGRDPALLSEGELWPDHIIEVQPNGSSGGTIVWEWHAWDHLIQDFDPTKANFGNVAQHPELIDINFPSNSTVADWHHMNAINYNPQLDQILLSVRDFNEVWVIDHSTTTAEAAGHTGGNSGKGGDILYRWGNPAAYRAGTANDQALFGQHDAEWIKPGLPGAGNILVFSNGNTRPGGPSSSVDEIVPPVDAMGNYTLLPGTAYGPAAPTWTYQAPNPSDFFAPFVSSSQRLPNGNTLICAGTSGHFFEVTPTDETVWTYVSPLTNMALTTQGAPTLSSNQVFRATRYEATHPGFVGRDLSARDPVEHYPIEIRARFGNVNDGGIGGRADVLLVNGSAGDVWRELWFSTSDTVNLTMVAPPTAPAAAPFVLNLLLFEPGIAELQLHPFGLAALSLPDFGPAPPPAFTLANTVVGSEPILGTPILPGVAPAPSTVLSGNLPMGTFAVQGIVLDPGSLTGPGSITNAVIIHVQ